ncbi:MAG TPA: helix-turn-helix transcriptional regulator [Actinomycetota bacterium]|nr:helix-turn-helix transcriptional regulator [Actinomycetota bacterium]
MGEATGAERYFAGRMLDPAYASAYEEARARVSFIDGLMGELDRERRRSNLSKAELARRAGLRPEAVRRIFSKTPANPTLATIYALAKALDSELKLVTPKPTVDPSTEEPIDVY